MVLIRLFMVKKTAIKSLIIQHKKNTLKTHFKDIFLRNIVSYSVKLKLTKFFSGDLQYIYE